MAAVPCSRFRRPAFAALGLALAIGTSAASAAPVEPVRSLAAKEKAPLIETLKGPEAGLKMNWTVANAGTNRNVIPTNASASADVRVLRVADYNASDRAENHHAERPSSRPAIPSRTS